MFLKSCGLRLERKVHHRHCYNIFLSGHISFRTFSSKTIKIKIKIFLKFFCEKLFKMSENINCTEPENKTKRNLNLDILTFMQLDVMATWLTNETNELYREFLNKAQFVREQDIAISVNETELQKLLENIKRLETISAEVTFEIKQWDRLLDKSCETVSNV
ncbi:uncharacterized protein ACN2A1_014335 isoform 2-T2 [Glossina fuscipes fuscipes]